MSCVKLNNLKYVNRPGPPYPANAEDCQGRIKVGNDSRKYVSKEDKNGVFKWILIKSDDRRKKPKKSIIKSKKSKKRTKKKVRFNL